MQRVLTAIRLADGSGSMVTASVGESFLCRYAIISADLQNRKNVGSSTIQMSVLLNLEFGVQQTLLKLMQKSFIKLTLGFLQLWGN